MTRLASSRIYERKKVKTTLALLHACADRPKYRRVLRRIERARERWERQFRR